VNGIFITMFSPFSNAVGVSNRLGTVIFGAAAKKNRGKCYLGISPN